MQQQQSLPRNLQPGLLQLVLVRGHGLKDQDWFHAMDPYCLIKWRHYQIISDIHKRGGCQPVWNQQFDFSICEQDTSMEIEIMDYDRWVKDDKVGTATLCLIKARQYQGKTRLELPVFYNDKNKNKNKPHGTLVVTVNFTPATSSQSFKHSGSFGGRSSRTVTGDYGWEAQQQQDLEAGVISAPGSLQDALRPHVQQQDQAGPRGQAAPLSSWLSMPSMGSFSGDEGVQARGLEQQDPHKALQSQRSLARSYVDSISDSTASYYPVIRPLQFVPNAQLQHEHGSIAGSTADDASDTDNSKHTGRPNTDDPELRELLECTLDLRKTMERKLREVQRKDAECGASRAEIQRHIDVHKQGQDGSPAAQAALAELERQLEASQVQQQKWSLDMERLCFSICELVKLEMLLSSLPFEQPADLHAAVLQRLIEVSTSDRFNGTERVSLLDALRAAANNAAADRQRVQARGQALTAEDWEPALQDYDNQMARLIPAAVHYRDRKTMEEMLNTPYKDLNLEAMLNLLIQPKPSQDVGPCSTQQQQQQLGPADSSGSFTAASFKTLDGQLPYLPSSDSTGINAEGPGGGDDKAPLAAAAATKSEACACAGACACACGGAGAVILQVHIGPTDSVSPAAAAVAADEQRDADKAQPGGSDQAALKHSSNSSGSSQDLKEQQQQQQCITKKLSSSTEQQQQQQQSVALVKAASQHLATEQQQQQQQQIPEDGKASAVLPPSPPLPSQQQQQDVSEVSKASATLPPPQPQQEQQRQQQQASGLSKAPPVKPGPSPAVKPGPRPPPPPGPRPMPAGLVRNKLLLELYRKWILNIIGPEGGNPAAPQFNMPRKEENGNSQLMAELQNNPRARAVQELFQQRQQDLLDWAQEVKDFKPTNMVELQQCVDEMEAKLGTLRCTQHNDIDASDILVLMSEAWPTARYRTFFCAYKLSRKFQDLKAGLDGWQRPQRSCYGRDVRTTLERTFEHVTREVQRFQQHEEVKLLQDCKKEGVAWCGPYLKDRVAAVQKASLKLAEAYMQELFEEHDKLKARGLPPSKLKEKTRKLLPQGINFLKRVQDFANHLNSTLDAAVGELAKLLEETNSTCKPEATDTSTAAA